MATAQFTVSASTEATAAPLEVALRTHTHRGYTLSLIDAGVTIHYEGRFVGNASGMAGANTLIDADVQQRKAYLMKIMGRHEPKETDLI
jgi:hypothetical protein